ncbi:hypothetical protein [Pareuzebyella sediminis]|uniref:hypothetical protein n=1 Tax=Pareuzebyella sediminis TaxID=2607998 RepID=UPI0011ED4401|nr:hypothetical protein [Pareuzebyella sediminis]
MTSPSDYIKEFEDLKEEGFYSMVKIEFWLLKYWELYKESRSYVQTQDLLKMDDGISVRLPLFWNPKDEEKFLELYTKLDSVSEFQRNESYISKLLVEYHAIKNSQTDLKKWYNKNVSLFKDKYATFLMDYLDYDVNDKEEHLLVHVDSLKELEIDIDKSDFKNTIEFLEIFQGSLSVNQSSG